MNIWPFRRRPLPPPPEPVLREDPELPEWKRAFRGHAAAAGVRGQLFDLASAVAFLEAVAESVAPLLREVDFDPSPGAAELYSIDRTARLVQTAYSFATCGRSSEAGGGAPNIEGSADAWASDTAEATVIAAAMLEHLDILTPVEVRKILATLLSRVCCVPDSED